MPDVRISEVGLGSANGLSERWASRSRFLARWVAAAIAADALGSSLVYSLLVAIPSASGIDYTESLAAIAVAVLGLAVLRSLLLGWGQALVLRTLSPSLRLKDWILPTMFAGVAAQATAVLGGGGVPTLGIAHSAGQDGVAVWMASGLAMGAVQWLALRHVVGRAAWWIPVWSVAMPLSIIVSKWILSRTFRIADADHFRPDGPLFWSVAISVILTASIQAAITGTGLIALSRRPRSRRT